MKQIQKPDMPCTCLPVTRLPRISLIGRSVCLSDWQILSRVINDYELLIFYQGKAEFAMGNTRLQCMAGDWLLIPPQKLHQIMADAEDPCRFYYCHFWPDNRYADGMDGQKPDQSSQSSQSGPPVKPSGSEQSAMIYQLAEPDLTDAILPLHLSLGDWYQTCCTLMEKALAERSNPAPGQAWMIGAYILQILILVTRCSSRSNPGPAGKVYGPHRAVQKAVHYFHEHYQGAVSIAELSHRLGLSQQYLVRLFRQTLHCSPIQYLNQLRLDKAKDLLRFSDLTIKEIAAAVGFENPYYFSRLFRQREGMPPTRLRCGIDSASNT